MLDEARDPKTPAAHNSGYYPGGIYRYTKRFETPPDWNGQGVLLEFEGVYQRSQVFLNGVEIGGRPSGYAEFRVPLAPLKPTGENLLEVVVDNSKEPNSRWYTGSGIYRPVSVLVGPQVHIAATSPTVTTSSLEDGRAVIQIETTVINDTEQDAKVALTATVSGPDGTVAEASDSVIVPAGGATTATQTVEITDPHAWSVDSPSLYNLEVEVKAGERVDSASTRFGIRTLSVSSEDGLLINGEPTKLRGACIHHDNGVIGARALKSAEHRRVRLLKEAGFNAIRSAHNPVSRAMLDACDELGMLVMDELTDVWTRPKTYWDYSVEFAHWWQRDLESMIDKDRNHPCVIMYSIGNEIGETAVPFGIALNREIANKTRDLDPTRPVTNGINGLLNLAASPDEDKAQRKAEKARASGATEAKGGMILILNLVMGAMSKFMSWILPKPIIDKKTRDAFADLDVAGYNHMGPRIRSDHALHPDRVIVGSEETPKLTISVWHDIKDAPHALGDFVWTGWDYLGEGAIAASRYDDRPRAFLPYPALLAGEPILDITGARQTQSYANEIAWGLRTAPWIAVRPLNHAGKKMVVSNWRTTDSIRSWTWDGLEGTDATVEVYGYEGEVELFLNGQPLGRKAVTPQSEHLATFTVPYAPGTLEAVLYSPTGDEVGRDSLSSANPGLRLTLTPESGTIVADGQDCDFVSVELTDGEGVLRPLADRPVTIEVEGPALLEGFGSAEPITEEVFTSTTHSTYYGRAFAVIRSTKEVGQIRVTATADGCPPASTVIMAKPTSL